MCSHFCVQKVRGMRILQMDSKLSLVFKTPIVFYKMIVFDFRNNERKLSANFRSAISDLLQAKLKVREDNKKGKQRFRREGRGKQEQSGMTTL